MASPELTTGASPSSSSVSESELLAAWLQQLDLSLHASQGFLLTHNLGEFQRCTNEQVALSRGLQHLLQRQHSATFPAALHSVALRIQYSARVQAGLLRRAQRHLAALFHLATSATATYAPPAKSSIIARTIHF